MTALNDSQVNWNGVYLDNYRTLLDLSGDGTADIANYPSDESFRTAQHALLDEFHTTLSASEYKTLVELPPYAPDSDEWKWISERSDGVGLDGFGRNDFNADDGYVDVEAFRNQIRVIEEIDRSGKTVLVTSYVPFWSNKGISLYGFAGSLLARDSELDRVYYYGREDASSIPAYWYHEYEMDFGNATQPLATSDDLLIRLFAKGAVVVNPTAEDRAIQFTETYQTYQGLKESSFVVPAHSSLLLSTVKSL